MCYLLVLVGLLQIIGHATRVKAIKGLGAVSTASPLPLVFTAVKGLETYTLEFKLEYTIQDHQTKVLDITPEVYSKFNGPYNRRNIYGAAFAYAPILPDTLRNAVFHNAFCGTCFLKNDLGISGTLQNVNIYIYSKTERKKAPWIYQVTCLNE
jgi:hypothetical protein